MPGISIIIPTYNREPAIIFRAIESIFSQINNPSEIEIELILSNNSQTELAAEISQKFPNIKILDSSKIPGVSYARNNGARHSRYEYLSFLDDDDYWSDNFIKSMYQKITAEKADMVVCGFKNIDDSGDIKNGKTINQSIKISDVLAYNPGFTGSNFIISRKKFNEIGGFDEKLLTSNDKDFLIRFLMSQGKYVVVKECLVYRDESTHQRLTKISKDKISSTELFFQKYKDQMDKKTKNEYEFKLNYYKNYLEKSLLKIFLLIFRYPQKYQAILSTIKNIKLKKEVKI